MRTEDIEVAWTRLCSERSAAKKYFDPHHPLQFLYGSDERGRAVMALISPTDLGLDDLSRDVATSSSKREDGKWATTWTLADPSLFETFVHLGVDLARRSSTEATAASPLESFLTVLGQWQLLLRPKPAKRLTLEKLRGLVAELWAGEEVVLETHSRPELVRAWTGPLGGAQDYTFTSGHLWEVKAKRSNATTVKVSSLQQLDPMDKQLKLVVMDLDERSIDTDGARSLVDLVESWREALAVTPADRHHFDLLVARLGVDLGDPYYAQTSFVRQRTTVYDVNGDFPSLHARSVPADVTDVRYQLDVRGLDKWIAETQGAPK